MNAVSPGAELLAHLPATTQDRLRAIGREAHGLFGKLRDHQQLFDAHVAFIDTLAAAGATHAEIGLLLAAVGVHRPDGKPLTRGTVSSALGRARDRVAARRGGAAAPAAAGVLLQAAAASGSELQQPESTLRRAHPPAGGVGTRQSRAAAHPAAIADPAPDLAEPDAAAASRPSPPPNKRAAAVNLRAASIVSQLRRSS